VTFTTNKFLMLSTGKYRMNRERVKRARTSKYISNINDVTQNNNYIARLKYYILHQLPQDSN